MRVRRRNPYVATAARDMKLNWMLLHVDLAPPALISEENG
jgi:hypothetical protein